MRKLTRPPAPPCLEQVKEEKTQQYIACREQGRTASACFAWPGGTCYQEIKEQLLEMTQGRCAFCDGPFVESPVTVEHFRPKSDQEFFGLAYAWDNLFPCCSTCQGAKRDHFDPALLKPDEPDYDFLKFFRYNFYTGELEASSEESAHRAEATIQIYNLNKACRKWARKAVWKSCEDRQKLADQGEGAPPVIDDFHYRFIFDSDVG